MVHTLRWGPDGMLYFNQSIYIHSHIETPYGVTPAERRRHLAVPARDACNWRSSLAAGATPGAIISIAGASRSSPTGPAARGSTTSFPGPITPPRSGRRTILHGLNPGSPKYCGLEIVSGRHLPDDWQGNMLTNDFRGHRVCRFVVTPDGLRLASPRADRADQEQPSRLSPHRRQDGPGRRHLHRRLVQPDHPARRSRFPRPAPRPHARPDLRVTAKDRPLVPRPQLVGAGTEALLEA